MSWIDKLTNAQKAVGAIVFFLVTAGAAIAWLPTPIHTDDEADARWLQASDASGCATVYELELAIEREKAKLNDPQVPEWRKTEIRADIERWREIVKSLRQQYKCVEFTR